MNSELYIEKLQSLHDELEGLPDHSAEEVRIAADQLTSMNADLNIGIIGIDMKSLNKEGVRILINKIEDLSFKELNESRNIEKPFDGGDIDAWCNDAKISRVQLLIGRYSLLCRLRSDEPEAWDEVNELFYDD